MGMELCISAERPAYAKNAAGETVTFTDVRTFPSYWAPNEIIYAIINSTDSANAYIAWVMMEFSEIEEFEIFAEDDVNREGPVIGVELVNEAANHVVKFNQWLNTVAVEGYTVRYYAI